MNMNQTQAMHRPADNVGLRAKSAALDAYLKAQLTGPQYEAVKDMLLTQEEIHRIEHSAALGDVAMRFVDRAGDVHPGIDDADRICAEFSQAMGLEQNRWIDTSGNRPGGPGPRFCFPSENLSLLQNGGR